MKSLYAYLLAGLLLCWCATSSPAGDTRDANGSLIGMPPVGATGKPPMGATGKTPVGAVGKMPAGAAGRAPLGAAGSLQQRSAQATDNMDDPGN